MTNLKLIRRLASIFATSLIVALASSNGYAQPEEGDQMTEIASGLSKISSEKSGVHRSRMASELAVRVKELGPECITDKDLSALIDLLKDDDDSVRFFAATMIGNSGPRGVKAITALEEAIADRPCENMALTSAAAIRATLVKFGRPPPSSDALGCQRGLR